MSPKELSESLGRLAEKATPGPWESFDTACGYGVHGPLGAIPRRVIGRAGSVGYKSDNPKYLSNMALIVALRNNLPAIRAALDVVRAAEAVVAEPPIYTDDTGAIEVNRCVFCERVVADDGHMECPWADLHFALSAYRAAAESAGKGGA